MFGVIKSQVLAGIAAVVAVFVIWFKIRGEKIEALEEQVERAEASAEAVEQVHEDEVKAASFVAANREAAKIAEEVVDEDTTKYDPSTKFYI